MKLLSRTLKQPAWIPQRQPRSRTRLLGIELRSGFHSPQDGCSFQGRLIDAQSAGRLCFFTTFALKFTPSSETDFSDGIGKRSVGYSTLSLVGQDGCFVSDTSHKSMCIG
jgi:hypothetical protein